MVRKRNKLVYGVAINDSDYITQKNSGGKSEACSFYVRWQAMIKRCYSSKFQSGSRTYEGCRVCDEWLTFSNFKRWMEKQDWKGKELDKDILVKGNKIYSPETCVFVSGNVNSFVIEKPVKNGGFKTGVSFHVGNRRFQAQCRNPFTGKIEHIGYFDNEDSAHLAWRGRKMELAKMIAMEQSDKRVSDALLSRYA